MPEETQLNKILNLLSDFKWHCTSEMAALYIVDYRRRLVDLQRKGYRFNRQQCKRHNHPMKEWQLIPEELKVQSNTEQNKFYTLTDIGTELLCDCEGFKRRGFCSHTKKRLALEKMKNQLSFNF